MFGRLQQLVSLVHGWELILKLVGYKRFKLMLDSIGKAKAAVLPVPVCAIPKISPPFSKTGIACS